MHLMILVDNFSTEVETVTVHCELVTEPDFSVWKVKSLLDRDQL